jgi:hypothetical protein
MIVVARRLPHEDDENRRCGEEKGQLDLSPSISLVVDQLSKGANATKAATGWIL